MKTVRTKYLSLMLTLLMTPVALFSQDKASHLPWPGWSNWAAAGAGVTCMAALTCRLTHR